MTSLIALYQRRGTVLLLSVGVLLLGIIALLYSTLLTGLPDAGAASTALTASLFSPMAQFVAGLFWVTLSLLIGLIWARAFFGTTTLSETFVVGALLGAGGFPILYAFFLLLFEGLARAKLTPEVIFAGEPQVYALIALFALLLVGILLLIGREVVRALRKPL